MSRITNDQREAIVREAVGKRDLILAGAPAAAAAGWAKGALKVAVELLREATGPLEVSNAVLCDEDGGDFAETLLTRMKRFVEQYDRAALSVSQDATPQQGEAEKDAARLDWLESKHASLSAVKERSGDEWVLWWQVTDGRKSLSGHPLGNARAAIDAALSEVKR